MSWSVKKYNICAYCKNPYFGYGKIYCSNHCRMMVDGQKIGLNIIGKRPKEYYEDIAYKRHYPKTGRPTVTEIKFNF